MKITTIDIETIDDLPLPDPGEEAPFPSLHLHRPVVISWLCSETHSSALRMQSRKLLEIGQEEQALIDIGNDIRSSGRIVTFNGRCFDMPLLGIRAMRHGVNWSFWSGCKHRFPSYNRSLIHHDMQDIIGDFGAARNFSLDGVCEAVGLAGKPCDVSGSGVKRLWLDGEHDTVVKYCENDVLQTYLLYLKWSGCHENDKNSDRMFRIAIEYFGGSI